MADHYSVASVRILPFLLSQLSLREDTSRCSHIFLLNAVPCSCSHWFIRGHGKQQQMGVRVSGYSKHAVSALQQSLAV
jgi:hypothetical protein